MTLNLRDAVVAVTGAGHGIGAATAQLFAENGARVALGDIDADAAMATAARIGRGATGHALDVSQEQSFAAFLDAVESHHGPLTVMINNAGVDWMGHFHEEPTDVSSRQLAVNLQGPIIGSRLALQRMLPRGRGHLVNVASGVGRIPQPGSTTYSATKFGVVGLTESLRLEYFNSGVRFTVIQPGYVKTRMVEGTSRPSRLVPQVTAEDCARAIFNAVDKNKFDVHVPASQGASLKVLNTIPRVARDRIMFAIGLADIADKADAETRGSYHDTVFGDH